VFVPNWWQETLLNTRFNDPDSVHFDEPAESPYVPQVKDKLGQWAAPRNVLLEKKDKGMQVTVDKQSVLLPEEYLHDNYGISALRTDQSVYLAVHGGIATPFELVRIDTGSGKVAWHSDVVAD
jgi:hypothetical protein